MSFVFTHDGHEYRLDTSDGQVHCEQLDEPQQESLETVGDDE